MRIALIADWLPTYGGAEHVVAALHRAFPTAPIFTTIARPERLPGIAPGTIRVSKLQIPFRLLGTHTVLLPWMPQAMERWNLDDYDVIVSSSHAVAKGIIPRSSSVHICYCHTPMRYAWEMEEEYLHDFSVPRMFRTPIRKRLAQLRRWDMTTSKRVDHFIANSTTTQERITRFYGRDSAVIHPPIDDRFLAAEMDARSPQKRDYYLAVGRLVPYKRFDLLISVANTLKLPLVIAGTGRDFHRLKQLAGPTVDVRGFVPEAELPDLYARAKALLFPQLEDAGVAALEAQACGTPVIALGKGGALDTIRNGVTGVFFSDQSPEALTAALETFSGVAWNPEIIRSHATSFREEKFQGAIRNAVMDAWHQYGRVR